MTSPTTDTQSLESLLERVREATGPDMELDWELHRAFNPDAHIFTIDPVKYKRTFSDGVHTWNVHFDRECYSSTWQFPKLSASLDACAALQAEVLPGSMEALWSIEDWPGARLIFPVKNSEWKFVEEDGNTVCLAWIAAILSALIAKGETV